MMFSAPEIREAKRNFKEIYTSLNGFEKLYYHKFINTFNENIIKKDWANWSRNKNNDLLTQKRKSLSVQTYALVVFSFVVWAIIFFQAVADRDQHFIFPVILMIAGVFAKLISNQNSISLLEIEADKNTMEMVIADDLVRKMCIYLDPPDLIDTFIKSCETNGRSNAQDIFMPSISLSIASMIKSNGDTFFFGS